MAVDNLQPGISTDDLVADEGGEAIVLDIGAGPHLTVPGGTMMLTADFVRAGPDLIIEGQDGSEIIVRDYYTVDDPPALMTSGGAQMPADLVHKLAGSMAPGQYAQAAPGEEPQPIGTVQTITGSVTVVRADGTEVTLSAGAPVFQGDVIETGGEGSVGIVFVDDTTFSLGEEGRMVLDELVYDAETHEGNSAFSVVQGVFSFVSGSIAKSGSDAMQIRTPVATIGIRGTKVAVKAGAEGEENVITLLEEEGGITGEIVVSNDGGEQILNQAGQTTTVTSFLQSPSAPVVLPQAQLDQLFGSTINVLPPSPAAQREAREESEGRREDGEAERGEAGAEGEEEAEEEGEGEEGEEVAEGEG
ncbi:MAG TPA: FecR domain-containing protein, partial [Alphaproteobacteria bacterium]|nr:FecR domain-containing protein [Alphaproteobacteria bacterium]